MGWTIWISNPNGGKRFFLLHTHLHQPWGSSSLLYNEYWKSFLGVKQPQHSTDHPTPCSAKAINKQSYIIEAEVDLKIMPIRNLHTVVSDWKERKRTVLEAKVCNRLQCFTRGVGLIRRRRKKKEGRRKRRQTMSLLSL